MSAETSTDVPIYTVENLSRISNEKLGMLVQGLGEVATTFRENERQRLQPASLLDISPDSYKNRTPEAEEQRLRESQRFHRAMDALDGTIGERFFEIAKYVNLERTGYPIDQIVSHADKPVAYASYWYTDDLDDPDRDYCEIQFIAALNGFAETEIGPKVLQEYIGSSVLSGSRISPKEVPGGWKTFGTIPPAIFEPFVRPTSPAEAS